jgi:N-hydroxyarylamine O-acetyltransferase
VCFSLQTGGVLTDGMLSAYLARMGVQGPVALDAGALRDLHRAHLMAVPFENLSIHLGEPISLDEADLIGKIAGRRRGGFCYELNGAFASLLERLGAHVRRVSARAHGDDGRLGPPFDHLAHSPVARRDRAMARRRRVRQSQHVPAAC